MGVFTFFIDPGSPYPIYYLQHVGLPAGIRDDFFSGKSVCKKKIIVRLFKSCIADLLNGKQEQILTF
jgi:hypothetical protein